MTVEPARGRGQVAGLIAAAVLALVGLGAAIAIVATADGPAAGKASARAVVEATVAALAAGDGDAAVALMPTAAELAAAFDCDDGEASRAVEQGQRAAVWAKARAWKARRPRLQVIAPDVLDPTAAGQAFGPCTARRDVALQAHEVTLDLDGGGHGEATVAMRTLRLGARWYLIDIGELPHELAAAYTRELVQRAARRHRPGRLPGALRARADDPDDPDEADDDGDATDSDGVWAALGGEAARLLTRARTTRDAACACTDVACADGVQAQIEPLFARIAEAHVSAGDQARLARYAAELSACLAKVRADAAPPAGLTGIPECDAYVRIMEAYLTCDKFPASSRDGLRQSLDAMKQSWASAATMPDEAKRAMGDACKQGVDGMRQAGDALGCPQMTTLSTP